MKTNVGYSATYNAPMIYESLNTNDEGKDRCGEYVVWSYPGGGMSKVNFKPQNNQWYKSYWSQHQCLETKRFIATSSYNGWRTTTQNMCIHLLPYESALRALKPGEYDISTNINVCFRFNPKLILYLTQTGSKGKVRYASRLNILEFPTRNKPSIKSDTITSTSV